MNYAEKNRSVSIEKGSSAFDLLRKFHLPIAR